MAANTAGRQMIAAMRVSGLLVALWLLVSCAPDPRKEITYRGTSMGTSWSVKVFSDQGYSEALANDIQTALDEIDNQMSNWIPDSDISRFNALEPEACTQISTNTKVVLRVAEKLAALSEGAFDITVAPLVDLWGFGVSAQVTAAPSDEAIRDARSAMGMSEFSYVDGELCKHMTDVQLNVSALAKGYGVDRVAAMLDAQAYMNYLIEVGGELRANGVNGREKIWTVGVEQPDDGLMPMNLQYALPLENSAVATSGDYRNFFQHDGQRYSHILDPTTGYPVTHTAASVTVVSSSAIVADAWATALLVLGPEQGMAIAHEQGLAVMMIFRDGQGFATEFSDAWPTQ